MTVPAPAVKVCTKCEEEKNLSNFGRDMRARDRHKSWCADCMTTATKAYQSRKRAEMGDEKWRAKAAAAAARSREKPEVRERGRVLVAAQWAALAALRDRHRAEYEHLLKLVKRGELPAPRKAAE